jgi:predicted Zn-dependent protease
MYLKRISALLAVALIMVACAKTPFTGRSQLKFVPSSAINSLALTEYQSFLQKNPPVSTGKQAEMVKRVGDRLAKATEVFFKANGMEKDLAEFKWEFNLVNDPTINAWCMPGGKVVVYTGIMPVCDTEDGLAVVMGHEIAHALAHHGNERMSQQLAAQLGGMGIAVALRDKPSETQAIFNQAYGVASNVGVLLPFSRKHETEADEIGLYIMAMAGYDPNAAAPFWERMQAATRGAGQAPPEFLSTHPSPATRSATLRALVPKALGYRQQFPVTY